MKLIATRMLRGADVMADAGDEFECSAEAGAAYLAAGVARKPDPVAKPDPAPPVETAEEQPAEPVERAIERKAKPRTKLRRGASKKVSGKK